MHHGVAFEQDSNGYVELLRAGETPFSVGLGSVANLISADEETHSYLMGAYDDLSSASFGQFGYELRSDRAIFYWNTETYCDEGAGRLNEYEIILHDSGQVDWNFNTADVSCFDFDLFSCIYLGHDQEQLFEIAGGSLPSPRPSSTSSEKRPSCESSGAISSFSEACNAADDRQRSIISQSRLDG